MYGYGGDVKCYGGNQTTSLCFALNGDITNPHVTGIDGVLAAYENAIKKVSLSSPTNFGEVLSHVVKHVASQEVSQQSQKFHILMMLTDGGIDDIDKTIE